MEPKKRKEGSPKEGSSNLVMGQVTILRRGQSLDSSTKGKERDGQQQQQQRKKKQERDAAAVLSSVGGGDLIVFGTGRLGPDPAAVPKKIRLGEGRREAGAGAADVYAGSAFSNSPSPRALPLPNFSRRREGGGCGGAVVDPHSATKDLRRLLRLD